jgi:hypothetical protein
MNRRGQTLVATLIVLAIMAMLAIVLMNGSLGPGQSTREDGKGTTIPGKVMYMARDDKCMSNLAQTRAAIMIARSNADDLPPASMDELKLGKDFLKCSIDPFEPYEYNAEEGTVKCPHPGHDKY